MKKSKVFTRLTTTIVLLAILLFGVTSCSKNEDMKGNTGTTGNSIKIYMWDKDVIMNKLVSQYQQEYPKAIVEMRKFDQIQEYMQKLSSEIMAGEGPDVLYFSNYDIGSLYKLFNIGVFADLDPLIKNDVDFDIGDYNSKILECGIYKKQRLFIPFNYKVPAFCTTKEVLQKNNISFDYNNYNSNDFFTKIEPYISSIQQDKDRYVFSNWLSLEEYIASSGLKIIDYEKKQVYFDEPEFIQLIKNFKKIYRRCAEADVRQSYLNQDYDMLKSGDTLFINGNYIIHPNDLMFSNSMIKGLLGQTEVIYPLPKYNGDNSWVAVADKCLAINNNSNNKQNAFDFIKVALSEKIQSDNDIHNIPVNSKVLDKLIYTNKTKQDQEIVYNDKNIVLHAIPDELLTKYSEIINNVGSCSFIDANIAGLLYQALVPYFEDKTTVEKAIDDLKNKAMIYLNE